MSDLAHRTLQRLQYRHGDDDDDDDDGSRNPSRGLKTERNSNLSVATHILKLRDVDSQMLLAWVP